MAALRVGYFITDLVSSTTQLRNGWIRRQMHLESLGKRSWIAERRTKRCTMILAMVCKLDFVKTVTHKRGFQSWRKLCKEDVRIDHWDVVARVHESSGMD